MNWTWWNLIYVIYFPSLPAVVSDAPSGFVGCAGFVQSNQCGLCGGKRLRVRWRHWSTRSEAWGGTTKWWRQICLLLDVALLEKKGAPPRFVFA